MFTPHIKIERTYNAKDLKFKNTNKMKCNYACICIFFSCICVFYIHIYIITLIIFIKNIHQQKYFLNRCSETELQGKSSGST